MAKASQSHLLLRRMLVLLLLLLLLLAAADQQQAAITLKDCADKCGDMSIPFPFGMGKPGCFREGFEVICNTTFTPPRVFISNYDLLYNKTAKYPFRGVFQEAQEIAYPAPGSGGVVANPVEKEKTYSLVELAGISLGDGQAKVYGPVASDCASDTVDHTLKLYNTVLDRDVDKPTFPFLLSATHNVLIGIGRDVQPQLTGVINDWNFWASCLTYGSGFLLLPTNGVCSGRGCCETAVPADTAPRSTVTVSFDLRNNSERNKYPCNYGMVAEKSWYNFSVADSEGAHEALSKKYSRGVPIVVDFAIRNGGACPAANGAQPPPADYACLSANSYCANAAGGATGYICKCSEHYEGNPYIPDGCQDIDECQRRKENADLAKKYPCSSNGVCKNTVGGYDCPCKPGMKGNGKEGTCADSFPLAAKLVVGFAGLIVVILFMVMVHQLRKLKRFYEQNGGPLLNGVKNIKIYSSAHMKRMTSNYKDSIGQGHFGKVYLGVLKDQQKVAIKKSIKVDEDRKKEFTDEIIIQSEMRQKNIVRLIGCCLEMDVPMLVYEFVVRGSLYDILFGSRGSIPVDTRLKIAIGSAEGLAYMHSAGESTIRHGDVKSANILLDENFTPKVSDFGTSKLLERGKDEKTELVIGDMSYIDPIYMEQGIITQKSDVYSFGIVLIELITRRPATYDDKRSYVANFVQATIDRRARNFIDNDITSEADIEILEMIGGVAVECLKPNPEERLDMKQVEHRLHVIGQSTGVENPNLSSSPTPDDIA